MYFTYLKMATCLAERCNSFQYTFVYFVGTTTTTTTTTYNWCMDYGSYRVDGEKKKKIQSIV